jgi:hypothetical protein
MRFSTFFLILLVIQTSSCPSSLQIGASSGNGLKMRTAHSGPSLFDHLKSVFFNSATAMLIFTILLDGFLQIFHTKKIDDWNDASTSFFLLFLFFSPISNCYCTEFF